MWASASYSERSYAITQDNYIRSMQGLILLMPRCHSLTRLVCGKTQTRWLRRATAPLGPLSFPTIYRSSRRKCKTQTECEMTKGGGLFVLPPHVTKMGALRPCWSPKANIPFGFGEHLDLDLPRILGKIKECHPIPSMDRFTDVRSTAGPEGWSGLRMKRHFYLPISPFLISSQSTSRTRHATNILGWP